MRISSRYGAAGWRALVLGLAASAWSCTSPDSYVDGSGGETGSGSGGAVASGSGGAVGSGSGGAVARGSGGSVATGSGGRVGSGGATVVVGSGGRTGGSVIPNFLDDFEDGNTETWIPVPDPPSTWTVVMDGTTKVAQSSSPNSDEAVLVGGNVNWTDQVVEAKVKLVSGSVSSSRIFLYARFKDLDNYYYMYLEDDEIQVRRWVNRSSTTITRVKIPIVPPATDPQVMLNTWYTLKLAVRGGTVTGYVNGLATPDFVDTAPITNGGIAIGVSEGTASFDDVRVTP